MDESTAERITLFDPRGERPRVLRGGMLDLRRSDRFVNLKRHMPRARHEAALLHDMAAAGNRQRHDRQPRLERKQKAPAFESADVPVRAARALGKNDQRNAVGDEPAPAAQNARPIWIAAIDQQMPGAAQVPTEKRELPERFLRDDAQLKRQRRENHRDVVDALVIRDEHVGFAALDAVETSHAHIHSRRRQDQPRPRAGAPVRLIALRIDERRKNRKGAEHDGVNGDGRNEKENSSPPVEWRDAQLP